MDLDHALTVSERIRDTLKPEAGRAARIAGELFHRLLAAGHELPTPENLAVIKGETLDILERLVEMIERKGIGTDRLGQQIRNVYELLDEPIQGLDAGLRAGENPNSALRPLPEP